MVNCPNCGTAVASNQRFCGNCGTDVQTALAARGAPIAETPQAPYAYAQPTYGYDAGYNEPARGRNRLVLVLAVLVIVACCAFACGLLLGFELIPDLLGIGGGIATPRPTPRVTPTPQSLIWLLHALMG